MKVLLHFHKKNLTHLAFRKLDFDSSYISNQMEGNPGLLIIAKRSDDVEDVTPSIHVTNVDHTPRHFGLIQENS